MNTRYQFTYCADVVVCGGGVAGCMAAMAAADEGKSVAVIEQFGQVGGSATAGLVTPLMPMFMEAKEPQKGDPCCSYLSEELNARMIKEGGAACYGRFFDPMTMRIILEQMMVERGVKLFYHTFLCDADVQNGVVKAVVVQNKSGRGYIEGKMFIDCTGDGDLGVLAGAGYRKGDEETGKNQPVSLRYLIGGVDIPAFDAFVREYFVKGQHNYWYDPESGGLEVSITSHTYDKCPLTPVFLKAIENGDLIEDDLAYWQMFYVAGRRDSVSLNNPEFFDHTDASNADDMTYIQVEGIKAILRQLNFYQKYFKGFENAYLSEIADMVGVRESRRLEADAMLTAEDIVSHRKFPDAICRNNYPVDIHGKKLRLVNQQENKDTAPYYEIPYGCLTVRGFENLLVAGRCVGSDFVAQSSLRIQPICRALGEAAGIGAAMACEEGKAAREIDGSAIREKMIGRGARFE